jgi:hypothetical protein
MISTARRFRLAYDHWMVCVDTRMQRQAVASEIHKSRRLMRSWRVYPERCGHSHQIRQAIRFHFVHDLAAVNPHAVPRGALLRKVHLAEKSLETRLAAQRGEYQSFLE